MGLLVAAAGVSAFLLVQTLAGDGLPPGCGAGSGCGSVLASKWSRVRGVPVSAAALFVYGVAMIGLWRRDTLLFLASAGAILGSAAWLIVVQAHYLHAFCMYCMAAHALGGAAAAIGLACLVRRPRHLLALILGLTAAAGVAVAQIKQPTPVRLLNTAVTGDFDRQSGDGRTIGVFDGKLTLRVAEEPRLGRADARGVLVLFADYACPHCRALHDILESLARMRPEGVAVVVLPLPMWRGCNPYAPGQMDERFHESCDLARIALAVHLAAPRRFVEFDHWMFDPPMPRSAESARAEASRLIGRDAFSSALADPRIETALKRNIDAFGAGGADRVPVLVAPHHKAHAGKVEDRMLIEAMLTPP